MMLEMWMTDNSQQIRDFGLKVVSSAATRYSCDSTTVVTQTSSSYEPSVSLYYDTKLFDVLCPTVPIMTEDIKNKTLGRARDPRANGAWLSKLTERNMKCLS